MYLHDDTDGRYIFLTVIWYRRGRETFRCGQFAIQHVVVRKRARAQRRTQTGTHGERDGRGDAQQVAQRRSAAAVGYARWRGCARVRGWPAEHHPSVIFRHVRPIVCAARHRLRRLFGRVRQTMPAGGRSRGQPYRDRQHVRRRQVGRSRGRTLVSGKAFIICTSEIREEQLRYETVARRIYNFK